MCASSSSHRNEISWLPFAHTHPSTDASDFAQTQHHQQPRAKFISRCTKSTKNRCAATLLSGRRLYDTHIIALNAGRQRHQQRVGRTSPRHATPSARSSLCPLLMTRLCQTFIMCDRGWRMWFMTAVGIAAKACCESCVRAVGMLGEANKLCFKWNYGLMA